MNGEKNKSPSHRLRQEYQVRSKRCMIANRNEIVNALRAKRENSVSAGGHLATEKRASLA
jgi:hypothetical protein